MIHTEDPEYQRGYEEAKEAIADHRSPYNSGWSAAYREDREKQKNLAPAATTPERIATIEERSKDIETRLTRLEEWVERWRQVIHAIADRLEDAEKRNASIVIREVIDPWAETTTVEQLLHLLESECPVTTVIDALRKKQMTIEEKQRLAGNLYHISRESVDAIEALNVFKESEASNE